MWSALLVGARQAIKSVAASIMRSAWPLASKRSHKPSHQLDDDLPTHGSSPGTEPQAARSVYTTRDFFLTPGGKNYDQKLLAARILPEKYPWWWIWNIHILRGFRIHHQAPVKKNALVVDTFRKPNFLPHFVYPPPGTFFVKNPMPKPRPALKFERRDRKKWPGGVYAPTLSAPHPALTLLTVRSTVHGHLPTMPGPPIGHRPQMRLGRAPSNCALNVHAIWDINVSIMPSCCCFSARGL